MSHDQRSASGPAADEPGDGPPRRLSSERARDILKTRFTAAGMSIAAGIELQLDGATITLDGYDEKRAVGYLYYPADPDDSDRAETAQSMGRAFGKLADAGERHVLFIFQDDMPTTEVLERRIDAFFTSLPRQ